VTACGVSLGLALLLVAGCGETRADFADAAAGTSGAGAAGHSAGASAQAGLSSGGSKAGGGTAGNTAGAPAGSGGVAGGNGGAGESAAGGGAGGEGATGEAGASGVDPLLGVDCHGQHCELGDVCLPCPGAAALQWLCVPHPVTEPAAFAEATSQCEPPPNEYRECDGPEDCSPGRFCVAKEGGADGGQRCRDEPSPVSGSCCFTCGALPNCTLCRDDGDCPDGRSCVVVFEELRGCKSN
jgi:hypothetical protein